MSNDQPCARCGHLSSAHAMDDQVDGKRPCCAQQPPCLCPDFETRLDPSPPDGRDWDDSDDQGDPGAI